MTHLLIHKEHKGQGHYEKVKYEFDPSTLTVLELRANRRKPITTKRFEDLQHMRGYWHFLTWCGDERDPDTIRGSNKYANECDNCGTKFHIGLTTPTLVLCAKCNHMI